MRHIKGERLFLELNASQVRRRLKGHGFGVRKIESAGTGRAVIIHTATGEHIAQLAQLGTVRESHAFLLAEFQRPRSVYPTPGDASATRVRAG